LSQFADGGGWQTQVGLINPTDTQITGTIEVLSTGASGQAAPLNISMNGISTSAASYTIPPRSIIRVTTGNLSQTGQVGFVRITPAIGGVAPDAIAMFSLKSNGITVSEAGVSAITPGRAFRMYAEVSSTANANQVGSIQSGVAMANTSSSPNVVTLQLTGL